MLIRRRAAPSQPEDIEVDDLQPVPQMAPDSPFLAFIWQFNRHINKRDFNGDIKWLLLTIVLVELYDSN